MLKKLIVIMAVFALITGTAFAQASLGGQLMIGTTLLTGNSDSEDVNMGGQQYHEAKLSATFGDGKGGGKIVFTSGTDNAYGGGLGTGFVRTWGFLFWRPLEQFRMQVGVNADGDYGAAQISGWGFTGEAKNSVGAISDYMNWGGGNTWWPLWIFQSALTRSGNAFYPGTGDLANVNFSIFPVDGMQVHLVLPIGDGLKDSGNGGAQTVGNQLADFHFNLKYNIEEVGLVNVAFVGKGGLAEDQLDKTSVGNIYASFYLTALSGMNAELGLVFGLPWENEAKKQNDGYLGVGAGFRLDDGGPFTFKVRVNARFAGKTGTDINIYNSNGTVKETKVGDMPTLVYANILPCYKVNNNLWAFLYAGIGIESFEQYEGIRLGWFINPYIWVRAAEGLRFWTGVQIYQDGQKKDKFGSTASADSPVNWRIPFGFNFYF